MFDSLKMAPPDAILGLTDAYERDASVDKINLGVGVFADETCHTPVLDSVKAAETRLLQQERSKSYKPIAGDPRYATHVQQLLLGQDHPVLVAQRAVTAQSPGGTGALRIAGDLFKRMGNSSTVWISDPTWANHAAVFAAAGLAVARYPYLDRASHGLAFSALCDVLRDVNRGDVVVLHGCCHNPTGVDPTLAQWETIADILTERQALPLLDFAYQGFGDGLEEDAAGLRCLAARCDELVVCSSFSKNFGIYSERVGALTIVARDRHTAEVSQSNVKLCIRANYSTPPAHGAAIVTTILGDTSLKQQWIEELAHMRARINNMRILLVQTLQKKNAPFDGAFIMRQKGMFSMLGLGKAQAQRLRDKHAIYITDGGRINVAGITPANVDKLCDGLSDVVDLPV